MSRISEIYYILLIWISKYLFEKVLFQRICSKIHFMRSKNFVLKILYWKSYSKIFWKTYSKKSSKCNPKITFINDKILFWKFEDAQRNWGRPSRWFTENAFLYCTHHQIRKRKVLKMNQKTYYGLKII